MDPPVKASLITGIVALILAIWNFFTGRKSQIDLEILKSNLVQKNSEEAARREYEFEARKRLYHEYEPIKFQLLESCENASYLINGLCQRFVVKNNEVIGILPEGNYLNLAIMYHLMMPVVYFKIIKMKITNIDLQLDYRIHLQYLLNKAIYISFYSDSEICKLANIDYTPYVHNWKELREINPCRYRRQGFAVGRLDNAVEEFKIVANPDQLISFGDFERKIKDISILDFSSSLGTVKDLFNEFSPFTRPILWRIIIIQYVLHDLIIFSN